MKRKKIVSILLSLCISLSLMTSTAFAAELDSKNFEQAIVNVKSIVSISDDYKNFSHSSREISNGNNSVTVWDLEWETDDEKGGYISAKVDSYGNLCAYNNYNNKTDTSGLAKVSKEKAESTAKEFLGKAMPEFSKDMKLVNSNIYSDEYYFVYQQYVNDIPVNFIKVNVGVNKFSGEISSYSGLKPGTKKLDYPQVDNVIGIENAEKIYIDKIQNDLCYYSTYDYKEKKNNTVALYSFDSNKAVDAKSGEIVSLDNYRFNEYLDKNSGSNSVTEADSAGLSEVEKDEVNKVSGLISKEKAQEIINENSDLLSSMKIEDIVLRKTYRGDSYLWQLSFDGGNSEINASTGEIIGFYIYKHSESKENKVTKEEAKNKAEALLNRLAKDKFNQTKLIDDYDTSESSEYNFDYIREIDGKGYMSNVLSVSVDKNTGNIISYSNTWDNNISLPDISQSISKTDAFNKYNEPENFGLQYVLNENNTVGLVYNFSGEDMVYYIDSVSGKKIDRWGNEYKSNKVPEYSDIQGHWCEKTVKELLDSGYYIPGDKFNPDTNISQINFFRYMLSLNASDYSDDELYNILIDRGIIKEEEKNTLGAVTNKDAAKFITRYLGYEKLATNSKIFNNQFKDSIDDEYLGYANICYGLDIIKGDSKGNFNGDKNMTNAEAAVYIYNLVSQNNKVYL
ncbi:S-layer homology domain-containing protein [Clostridium butyricum]|uniref:S-layer homology domain-containing protein n=1 Tax=Clostridium butyricum TaxID=1492 RepID=UPI0003A16D36|nr:S-layer homology domain-containing protein [Clostridium butyricum]